MITCGQPAGKRPPEPPGPKGRGLRNLLARVRSTTDFMEGLHRQYGPVAGYRIGAKRFCLISDPALMEEILVTSRDRFHKGTEQKAAMENACIITADGSDHQRRRKLIQPSFMPKAITKYAEQMVSEAFRRQSGWHDGETIDFDEQAREASLAIAAHTFFGDDIVVDTRLIKGSLAGYRWLVVVGLLPFGKRLRALPLPGVRSARRAIARLDEAIYEAIRRARDDNHRTDLISHLAGARDEDGVHAPYSEAELKDEAFAILVAGHETTAATLTWCIYHICRNPGARDRLEQEIDAVLGDRLPTFHDYDDLVYTKAIVDEALRLTPPAPYLGRTAVQDVVIGGYHIAKGTIVQPYIRMPMRQEKYFEDAHRFMPERWLQVPQPGRPRFAYAPFGGGARYCSGFRFAWMELVLSLAVFCRRWRFDLVSRQFPAVLDLIIYKCKHGLPVTLTRRQPDA